MGGSVAPTSPFNTVEITISLRYYFTHLFHLCIPNFNERCSRWLVERNQLIWPVYFREIVMVGSWEKSMLVNFLNMCTGQVNGSCLFFTRATWRFGSCWIFFLWRDVKCSCSAQMCVIAASACNYFWETWGPRTGIPSHCLLINGSLRCNTIQGGAERTAQLSGLI